MTDNSFSDTEIRLFPSRSSFGDAVVFIKRRFQRGECRPENLTAGIIGPPIPERTDFWPAKKRVDVIVEGFAYAPGGSARTSVARLRVGTIDRSVTVFGPRIVTRKGGQWDLSDPLSFERIALVNANAYGGIDSRVEVPEGTVLTPAALVDHPGLYPRNRLGKGYCVGEPFEGMLLPELEDPSDLLTPSRLSIPDPRRWHEMPLPWGFDWSGPLDFPRCTAASMDAWFPAPPDTIFSEVTRGFTPSTFRDRNARLSISVDYTQEASTGMTLDRIAGGEELLVDGMHPTKSSLHFSLPALPRVEMALDGVSENVDVRAHTLVVRPDDESFSIVYAARMPLRRALIAGVHRRFPVTARVDGGPTIECVAPETARDVLHS